MKKVISLVLCLMLVMSLATTAFAADVQNNTTHSYLAYQIFSGTQSAGSGELGNIQWGSGIDGEKLLAELKTVNPTLYAFATNAETVAAALQEDTGGASRKADAEQFANVAVKYIKGTGVEIAKGATTVDLPAGYYLLVDNTLESEIGQNDARNPALLQVTNVGKITIDTKYEVPIPDKNILTEDDAGDHNHTKVEDYSIGDDVTFHLKATMPAKLDDFDQYRLVFHDALSDGLKFNNDVKLTINGTEKTNGFTVNPAPGCSHDGKNCDFTVVIEDVIALAGSKEAAENAVIIVAYTAELTENAIVEPDSNPNGMALEFSNDPNWQPPTTNPGEVPPTSYTPWIEAEIYTAKVQINKIDGMTDMPLTGAAFTLTGTSMNKVRVAGEVFKPYETGETVVESNRYWKLTDGTYTNTHPDAVSDAERAKYQDVDKLYKLVTATREDATDVLGNVTDLTLIEVTVAVDKNGVLKFEGLGEGVYTIKETLTPAGYNTIEDITLTITFDEEKETYHYFWEGGATGASYSINVENNKGSLLPETGGVGTTLFYVFGGLMFAGAAVLLVTKKRMAK